MTNANTHNNADDEPLVAWEQQPGETDKQYRAFRVYRNLREERSLREVAMVLGHRGRSHLERWSSQNDWTERAAAYDEHLDQEQRAEEQRNLERMNRHEVRLVEFLRSLAVRRILGWDGGGDAARAVTPLDPNTLSARDIALLLREGTRIAAHRPERRNWRREAAIREQMIAPSEYTKTVRTLLELALTHIPEEGRRRFAEEVDAWSKGDYDP